MSDECIKGVRRVYKGCLTNISRMSDDCIKGVRRLHSVVGCQTIVTVWQMYGGGDDVCMIPYDPTDDCMCVRRVYDEGVCVTSVCVSDDCMCIVSVSDD